ncbi:DGQHR domain-containing protein [Bradyrhizobium ottawaense]|uniref:DGQHR domain-containing protein n=1 Tax=Bradyrhizobium ottawaense TaxID=931866 RepID=UPI0038367C6D
MKGTTKTKKFEYYALGFSQRDAKDAPAFILFHAPASELIEWADVDRLEPENPTGAQRPLRDLKVKKVAKFLDPDARNTIPTAIVVALDGKSVSFNAKESDDNRGKHGKLVLTMIGDDKPGLIIDGQHRAFGVAKHSATLHLNIVAFIDDDDAERAFQFVVINNSASRVSRDHIRALNLSFDKDELNNRLVQSAGVTLGMKDAKYEDYQYVDSLPPFKGTLNWPTNKNGYIAPNAIESALAETRDRATLLGIEDLERDFFLAIWSRIKSQFHAAWHEHTPEKPSHLLQKVTIIVLTIYVLDSLEAAQRMSDQPLDFANERTFESGVDRVLKRIPLDFWTVEWQQKELDTSQGRTVLLDALKTIDSNSRYNRPWYDRVSLVDPGDLAGQYERKAKKKKIVKKAAKKRRS